MERMKNKVISILVAVALAFVFWLYVVTVVSPESSETYYNIPVALQNESILSERGLMITSDDPSVDLRLRGNRTDLIELNSGNITVIANVASIETPGTHKLNYSVSYPGNISGISVAKSDPAMIELKVEPKVKKNVPVVLDYGESKVPDGLIADKENVELDFQNIEISGPQSVVDKITKALIKIDLNKQSQTLVGKFDYLLCDDNNTPIDAKLVTTNAEAVNLTLKVHRVKEIDLKLEIIGGGGATEETSVIKIEPQKIQVSGSDAQLADLNELVLGTINLGEIAQDGDLTFPIVLPEGVENQTGLVEAKVTIQFPNLATKTFRVTNITARNVPAGMRAELITKALEVTVRGPSALIGTMKEKDISAYVDFTGAKTGSDTKKAEIVLSDAFNEAGAVGSYSVSVTVRKG
jgi:YbbR domain-containing protein